MSAGSIRAAMLSAAQGSRARPVGFLLSAMSVGLGVALLVLTRVTMYSVGAGARSSLNSTGDASLHVLPRLPQGDCSTGDTIGCSLRHAPPLTRADLRAVKRAIPDAIALEEEPWTDSISSRGLVASGTTVLAVSSEWSMGGSDRLVSGRMPTGTEWRSGRDVALVDSGLAALFGGLAPGRDVVVIRGRPLRVTGVIATRGESRDAGAIRRIVIPIGTATHHLQADLAGITFGVRLPKGVESDAGRQLLRGALRRERRLSGAMRDNFAITQDDALLASAHALGSGIRLGTILLSLLALAVGGFGVFGIMMIAVSERIPEIGVRRAVGATAGAIRVQFLFEACTLTGAGALFGLAVAGVATRVIAIRWAIPAQIDAMDAAVGMGFGLATGVTFGWAPALRAATLDPIVALRHV